MEMVAHVRRRLAGAFSVLFGARGSVTRQAGAQGRSRQALYRDAAAVVAAAQSPPDDRRLADAEARLARQATRIAELEARLRAASEIDADRRAAFAATAQAEGVSLPVARRLLAVLLGPKAPGVAALGRASARAARHAGRLLEVLDAAARPRVERAAADEIFSARRRS